MRTCIFCGKKASSKEDVWPVWLTKRFHVARDAYMEMEFNDRNQTDWPTSKPELTVRRICNSCNNGWMSNLENKAKPIIESILDNKLKYIDVSAQILLSQWSVKTAMMLESIDTEGNKFYSDEDRDLMYKKQSIPCRTTVWIAKVVDHQNLFSTARRYRTSNSEICIKTYVTTMAFDSLAFQIITIKTPSIIPKNTTITYDTIEGHWNETLVKLWPRSCSSLLLWPKYGLDGEIGLNTLAQRLRVETIVT